MASAFNLTAQLNIVGPNNLRPIISNLRQQLQGLNTNVSIGIDQNTSRNVRTVTADLVRLNSVLSQTAGVAQQVNNNLNNIGSSFTNIQRGSNNAAGGVNNVNNALTNVNRNLSQSTNFMEQFGRQSALAVRRFSAFAGATSVIYGLTRAFSSAFDEFIKFDKELIKLVQVTGQNAQSLKGLTNEITRLSTSLGVSSSELINVSSTLAQAGLTASQTKTALEALAKASLAPSFDDLTRTVEGSIAAMRQFNIGASQLEGALGSINAVAAAFAVEAGDIIAAIQRTGGVFAAASNGVSQGTDALNEFVAVFTSVRQTTRESAETIATGLRTIFTRLQRGSTINFLKEIGINLTDLEGKFVGPYKAVELLNQGLRNLDPRDLRYSQIIEELGGFRQIGKVIPLIQQFSVAQQALKVAQTGSASLAKNAAEAQLSLANQFTKVREEFLAFVRSLGESRTFRTLTSLALGLASSLISVANAFKPILPYLAILGTIRGTQAALSFGRGFIGGFGGGGGGGGPTTGGGGTTPNTPSGRGGGGQTQNPNQQNVLNNATVVANTTAITNNITSLNNNTTTLNSLINAVNSLSRGLNSAINIFARLSTQRGAFGAGGRVLGFSSGGSVPGSGNGDSVPAMLEPGEFVMNKQATKKLGSKNLNKLNKYAFGGKIKNLTTIKPDLKKFYDTDNDKDIYSQININRPVDKPSFRKTRLQYRDKAEDIWNKASSIFIETKDLEMANSYIRQKTKIDPGYYDAKELSPNNQAPARFNRIQGALAERTVTGQTRGLIKLPNIAGADFVYGNSNGTRFVEVKNKLEKTDDSDLISKALLGYAFTNSNSPQFFKNNKLDNISNLNIELRSTNPLDIAQFAGGGEVLKSKLSTIRTLLGEFYGNDQELISKSISNSMIIDEARADKIIANLESSRSQLPLFKKLFSEKSSSVGVLNGFPIARYDAIGGVQSMRFDELKDEQTIREFAKRGKLAIQASRGPVGKRITYSDQKSARRRFVNGGIVQDIASNEGLSLSDVILEKIQSLGGISGVKKIMGLGAGDRGLSSLLQAGNIKAGKNLEKAADIVNKALETKQNDIASLTKVAVAGLTPIDYNKDFKWDIGNSRTVFASARGFPNRYMADVSKMQEESSQAASKFAENVQYTSIFGNKQPLVFDFDETLVSGADILDASGKPDIPQYSNRDAVKQALGKGRLTRLGAKLKTLIDADPNFIKQTRILTARPQSTADLLSSTLKSFGLPYDTSLITGVSKGLGTDIPGAKAANLAATEKLIDDSLANVSAAKKLGKSAFLYSEPKAGGAAFDELMGQGNIEGAIVEKALGMLLGYQLDVDKLERNRAVDFPDGLGAAAQFFDIDPNIPTEVKRTLNNDSFNKAREEFGRFFTENPTRFADGGVVPALLTPGEAVIGPELAQKIGYGKLRRMNRADKYASGGQISIVPGQGNSDTYGPVPLPVGSFVIRKKATQALGFNNGGNVTTSNAQQSYYASQQSARVTSIFSSISPKLADTLQRFNENLGGTVASLGLAATTLSSQLPKLYASIDRYAGTSLLRSAEAAGITGALQQGGANLFASKNIAEQAGFGRTGTAVTVLASTIGGAVSGYLRSREEKQAENISNAIKESDKRLENIFNRLESAISLSAEERKGLNQQLLTELAGQYSALATPLENVTETFSSKISRAAESLSGAVLTFASLRTATRRSDGGIVYASKGTLVNYEPKGTDTIPAMLSKGEFVVNARSTRKNLGLLNAINKNKGGIISPNYLAIGGGLRTLADFTPFVGSILDILEGGGDILGGKRGSGFGKIGMGIGGLGLDIFSGGLGSLGKGVAKTAIKTGLPTAIGNLGRSAITRVAGGRGAAGAGAGGGMLGRLGSFAGSVANMTTGSLALAGGQGLYSYLSGGGPTASQNTRLAGLGEMFKTSLPRAAEAQLSGMTTQQLLDQRRQTQSFKEGSKEQIDFLSGQDSIVVKTRQLAELNTDRAKALGLESSKLEEYIATAKTAKGVDPTKLSEDQKKALEAEKLISEARTNLYVEAFEANSALAREEKDVLIKQALEAQKKTEQGIALSKEEQAALDNVIGKGKEYVANVTREINEKDLLKRTISAVTASTRNFTDVINNLSSSLDRASSSFETSLDRIDIAVGSRLTGRAEFGKVDRTNENVFNNLRAYTQREIAAASAGISNMFGFNRMQTGTRTNERGQVIPTTLADTLTESTLALRTLEVELPRILRSSANVADNNQNIQPQIKEALRAGGLNETTAREIATQITNKLNEPNRQGNAISFSDIANDIPGFLQTIDSLKKPVEFQAKITKIVNDNLEKFNQKLQSASDALVRAAEIRSEFERTGNDFATRLSQSLGFSTSLDQQNAAFNAEIRSLSTVIDENGRIMQQGTTDPSVLAQRIEQGNANIAAEQERFIRTNFAGNDAEVARSQYAIMKQTQAVNQSQKALEKLANDSSRASNALNKIEERRGTLESRRSGILDVIGNMNNPDYLMQLIQRAGAVSRFEQGNASMEDISLIAQNIDQILTLRGGKEGQDFLRKFGLFIERNFAKEKPELRLGEFISTAFKPETDPIVQQMAAAATEYTRIQQEAQQKLIKQQEDAAKKITDTLPTAAEIFRTTVVGAAREAAAEFMRMGNANNGQQQQQAQVQANMANIGINGNANINVLPQQPQKQEIPQIPQIQPVRPVKKAKGGMIYASNGQFINFQPRGTDTVPAMLTPGEFVVNAKSTSKHLPLLKAINNGVKGYSSGGVVYLADGGKPDEQNNAGRFVVQNGMPVDINNPMSMNQPLTRKQILEQRSKQYQDMQRARKEAYAAIEDDRRIRRYDIDLDNRRFERRQARDSEIVDLIANGDLVETARSLGDKLGFAYQYRRADGSYSPDMQESAALTAARKIKREREKEQELSRRYKPVTLMEEVIAEISGKPPEPQPLTSNEKSQFELLDRGRKIAAQAGWDINEHNKLVSEQTWGHRNPLSDSDRAAFDAYKDYEIKKQAAKTEEENQKIKGERHTAEIKLINKDIDEAAKRANDTRLAAKTEAEARKEARKTSIETKYDNKIEGINKTLRSIIHTNGNKDDLSLMVAEMSGLPGLSEARAQELIAIAKSEFLQQKEQQVLSEQQKRDTKAVTSAEKEKKLQQDQQERQQEEDRRIAAIARQENIWVDPITGKVQGRTEKELAEAKKYKETNRNAPTTEVVLYKGQDGKWATKPGKSLFPPSDLRNKSKKELEDMEKAIDFAKKNAKKVKGQRLAETEDRYQELLTKNKNKKLTTNETVEYARLARERGVDWKELSGASAGMDQAIREESIASQTAAMDAIVGANVSATTPDQMRRNLDRKEIESFVEEKKNLPSVTPGTLLVGGAMMAGNALGGGGAKITDEQIMNYGSMEIPWSASEESNRKYGFKPRTIRTPGLASTIDFFAESSNFIPIGAGSVGAAAVRSNAARLTSRYGKLATSGRVVDSAAARALNTQSANQSSRIAKAAQEQAAEATRQRIASQEFTPTVRSYNTGFSREGYSPMQLSMMDNAPTPMKEAGDLYFDLGGNPRVSTSTVMSRVEQGWEDRQIADMLMRENSANIPERKSLVEMTGGEEAFNTARIAKQGEAEDAALTSQRGRPKSRYDITPPISSMDPLEATRARMSGETPTISPKEQAVVRAVEQNPSATVSQIAETIRNDTVYKKRGGLIYASNGALIPYSPRGTDTVPAMLTPGEFVVNRTSAQKHMGLLRSINNNPNQYLNKGGMVQYLAEGGLGRGGTVSSNGGAIDFSEFSNSVGAFGTYVLTIQDSFSQIQNLDFGVFKSSVDSLISSFAALNGPANLFNNAALAFGNNISAITTAINALSNIPDTININGRIDMPSNITVSLEGNTGDLSIEIKRDILNAVANALSQGNPGINVDKLREQS